MSSPTPIPLPAGAPDAPRAFLQRFHGEVTSQDRMQMFRHKPVTIWLTGLSGAGKSTIAFELERQLVSQGHACYILDGDNVRHGLASDLGFDKQDRRENIRRVAHVAQLMNDAGLIVITALISPMREDRAMAREIIGPGNFIETYLSASVDACARRDPKGLYAKALAGEIASFTGVSAPYEVPTDSELKIDTATLSPAESVEKLFAYLRDNCLENSCCAAHMQY
ncbi:adenylyl-sulfate kinase [Paraburkholderia fungorum]|uniref:Adenylyl-sulfate kinase n=1 Tax=Paraburkholderia fungorum TaxID=134537 RepID=A0A3R7I8I0_9BURK|nr:adenylyl-sulfate kinase [Paraburkholderia fungorum]RKF43509.1 adenylyl-sulfate kinase [Paraburkholderia fungorum]